MLVTLLAALLASAAVEAHGALRGVNPDLQAHYSGTGGTFTCVSGVPKTIPFSRVNDDYCDCPDGSDEPGTSACHNGRFYCRNLGHEPRLLASSFVDDGVCDCCDGADEPKGTCRNTCLEASAVHREALKTKILNYEQALQTKADYVLKARAFKEELSLKAGTIEEDIAKQLSEVQRMKDEVSRLEQAEAEVQAAAEAAKAEEARVAAEAAASTAPAEVAAPDASTQTERELQEEVQETQPEEREETPEERGRRIASQWTNDPEAAAVSDSHEEVTGEEQPDEGQYDPDDHHGDYDPGTDAQQDDDQGEHQDQHHQRLPRPPRRPDTSTPLGEARARLYDAEVLLGRLQLDKDNIRTYLRQSLDFGPDDVFLALADRCYTSHQTRWTYEACMFKAATQKEGYSNSVTVGRWYGFSQDYTTMYFTGGDECWNVGPRSFTVSMTCGWEEQLSDGEEPATCAYTAKFTSPALCTERELEGLRQQLHSLEAFEREVQELINKAEQGTVKDEL